MADETRASGPGRPVEEDVAPAPSPREGAGEGKEGPTDPAAAPQEGPWRSIAAGGLGVFVALCVGSVIWPVLPQSFLSIPMLVLGGLALGWGALWFFDRFDFGGNIRAILHRELLSYFLSPIAYVVLVGFLVCNGIVFVLIMQSLSGPGAPHGAAMQLQFGGTIFYWILVIFAVPVLTMRTLAEERRSGTIETLMTAPVSDGQVVVAKYLGALVFYMVLWMPTALYVGLLHYLAPPGGGPEIGPVLAGYAGTFLIGSMFIGLGILTSALSRNQIVAAILAFTVCLALFVIGIFEFFAGPEYKPVLNFFNLWDHMQEFGKGIVDTRRIIYYVSGTFLALYAATKVVESRKWQ